MTDDVGGCSIDPGNMKLGRDSSTASKTQSEAVLHRRASDSLRERTAIGVRGRGLHLHTYSPSLCGTRLQGMPIDVTELPDLDLENGLFDLARRVVVGELSRKGVLGR